MKKKKKKLAKKALKKAKNSDKVFEVLLPRGNQIFLQLLGGKTFRPVYKEKKDKVLVLKVIPFEGKNWGVMSLGNRKLNLHGLKMEVWATMLELPKPGERFYVKTNKDMVRSFLPRKK